MGFHLSNFISFGTQTPSVQEPTGVSSVAQAQTDKGMAVLKSMSPGETLQGEVVAVNGNEVEVKIDENAVISAKLEKNMGVAVGQKMMFEVRNNSDGQVALRALFTNLAQEQLAQNALQAAGLPQNSGSMQLISNLMQQNMPIDKQSLQNIYHDTLQFPETDRSLLVQMHKMGMETTPANVEQFQALVQYEERVADTMKDLIKSIPGEVQNLTNQGEAGKAMVLTQELFSLLSEQEMMNAGGNTVGADTLNNVVQGQSGENQLLMGQAGEDAVIAGQNGENVGVTGTADALGNQVTEETLLQMVQQEEGGETAVSKALLALEEAMKGTQAVSAENENTAVNAKDSNVLSGIFTKTEANQLANILEQNGFSKETVAAVRSGNMNIQEFFVLMKNELPAKDSHLASELWNNKGFERLMTDKLQNAWLLEPQEVENGKNVTDFYNRLNHQLQSVLHSMSGTLSESSQLMQNIQQFQDNVDFLNNLNQFMSYVQLPLKMNGKSATGDLYVYADKKSLASGKDSVSAALHLDMQYLGHLDVYVEMQDRNVSTEFCLQDEAALDFLAEHIDILSERLEKRGYHMKSEMKIKEVPASLKDDIMPQTDVSGEANCTDTDAIAIYRFDVRA